MKHALGGVSGVVAGMMAAVTALFFNPLTTRETEAVAGPGRQLSYSFPDHGVLAHTHGGLVPFARVPPGVPELWEETIRSVALTTLRVEDEQGGGPLWATRITVPSTQTNLIFNGVVVSDYWLLSVPGSGSLFVAADANLWPVLKDTYLRVDLMRRPWPGPARYAPTLGPAESAALRGATGRFRDAAGHATEAFEIRGYSAAGGLEALQGRLILSFDGPDPFEPGASD